MRSLYFYPVALFITLLSSGSSLCASIEIRNLRTCYLTNPLGIDVVQPRFSWELSSAQRGELQTAYQITVGTDSVSLAKGIADVWDSRKVSSDRANQVAYAGKKLVSGQKYFWRVKVWGAADQSGKGSAIAIWSMGLLNKSDWRASWIGTATEKVPNDKKHNAHYGFQSKSVSGDNAADQWVTLDLGSVQEISQINLYPIEYKEFKDGYLFPKRFKIQVSNSPDFKNARIVVDESQKDLERTGLAPYIKKINPQKARCVRVAVTKLGKTEDGKFAFALAEVEILNAKSENIAYQRKATTGAIYNIYQPFSYENWLPDRLTDGFYKPHAFKPLSLPVPASPMLRKIFVSNKKVKSAMLYASALGLYEIKINGQKAGKQVLAPEWTDYHKRVQYQTYDVTSSIRSGVNVIGAMLADGWYAGAIFSHLERGPYGFDRRLIAQLEIRFEDGTASRIVTDDSWRVMENGPIQSASIFDGEIFNAKLLPAEWLNPKFDDSHWKPATTDQTIETTLSAQPNEPIKIIEEIKPVKITKINDDTYLFDLGQNIAGWTNLKLDYNPGGKITFRHGEVLDDKGSLYIENLRFAKQVNVYIPGTESKIDYEPRFTYHGFRYVEVSGLTKTPDLTDVTGKVVASAAPLAGNFESSSKDLNKLWTNILWTQRGNMHSVPTDCPQRDERAGWMGDAQVFAQTSIYNLDMAAFYTKWVRDIRDSQIPDGRYPDFAPSLGYWANFYNSPGWGDAGVLLPWRMYENYDDTDILANQYDSMKAYIRFILKMNPDLIWKNGRGNIYGDWLNGNTIISADYPKEGGKVPDDIYATAFFKNSTSAVGRTAKLLSHEKDFKFFDSLATAIKSRFIQQYVAEDGTVLGNTQAGYALALDFDLVPENLKKQVAAKMVQAIKDYDYRISTGIQTTIRLMNQLTVFGYQDVAYKLIESRRFPSWIYSIDQGATTIWERWDGYVPGRGFQRAGMNSFNHYAIGAVGEWMYRSILGINTDTPGYKHFIIKPMTGGSLNWAKGSYNSIAGKISVDWKKSEDDFKLSVEIPVNTTATIYLPAGKAAEENGQSISARKEFKILQTNSEGTTLLVQSGNYHFNVTW